MSVRVTMDKRAVSNNVTYWEDTEQYSYSFKFDTQSGTGQVLRQDMHNGGYRTVAAYPPHLLAEIVAVDDE